jgi:hypothetical protein
LTAFLTFGVLDVDDPYHEVEAIGASARAAQDPDVWVHTAVGVSLASCPIVTC